MRYILLGVTVFLASYVWAVNESVSAISFNPSRTGAYKHLKIVRKASLAGIDACVDSGGTCTSSADVNVETRDTVLVEGTCTDSDCFVKPEIKIDTITTDEKASGSGETLQKAGGSVETLKNSLVRGPGSVFSTGSLDFPVPSPSSTQAMGTEVTIYRGGTLKSTGKTFIGNLVVPKESPVEVKLNGTSDDKATLNLTRGKPIQVRDSISLGGVKIPSDLSGAFKWKTLGKTYKVLASN